MLPPSQELAGLPCWLLPDTADASSGLLLKRLSKWQQRDGADVESSKDLVFLVRSELKFRPVRVERGEPDLVRQSDAASAIKSTRQSRDRPQRKWHTGNQHLDWLLPPLSPLQTALGARPAAGGVPGLTLKRNRCPGAPA